MTVILTALAIVLALGGAIGYVTIREALTNAAQKEATSVAEREARAVAAREARKVATRLITQMVPRVAEEMARQVAGLREAAGDEIASAEGKPDVGGDAR